jgi:hypothetical protein
MNPEDDITAEDHIATNSGQPEQLLSVPDKNIDLGCGGCTHWLSTDRPDEAE